MLPPLGKPVISSRSSPVLLSNHHPRIILVADTVEAMTSDRPYRKALPLDAVVKELHKFSGSQFDPTAVNAFLALIEDVGEAFISKDQKFDIDSLIGG